MLRATTACNFSSLIWPAASAPAALASLLFEPPEPQIIGKTQRLSYLFAHLHLLSSDSFSSTLLSSNLSLLSASALLCFSSVHIVGSLTSKLPSTIYAQINHHCVCFTIFSMGNHHIIELNCVLLLPYLQYVTNYQGVYYIGSIYSSFLLFQFPLITINFQEITVQPPLYITYYPYAIS